MGVLRCSVFCCPGQGLYRAFGMSEDPFCNPGNTEAGPAVGVGTGDIGICGHPVGFGGLPLFGGNKRKDGRQGVEGELRLLGENQIFPDYPEVDTLLVGTDKILFSPDSLYLEIVEIKRIFLLFRHKNSIY